MKSTSKTKKSPAPATSASLAPAPAPKITRVPLAKKNGSSSAAPAALTVITAKIDVGFGNTLYIRGAGPGLTWNKGVPLVCAADDAWTISLPGATSPVVFKFLINDSTWSRGEDYSSAPGSTAELAPTF